MTWTKEQRAIAAADLAHRGARAALAGHSRASLALRCAADIVGDLCDAPNDYSFVLKTLDVASVDIDAAVDAIARGEHPPDSLPGRVEKMRGDCFRRAEGEHGSAMDVGAEAVLYNMLALLGCEVSK